MQRKRFRYEIHGIGALVCIREPDGVLWFQRVYIRPKYRGLGYAKWLFARSMLDLQGRTEVDVLRGVPALRAIFKSLGFQRRRRSIRYPTCDLWTPRRGGNQKSIKKAAGHQPIAVHVTRWRTALTDWETRHFTITKPVRRNLTHPQRGALAHSRQIARSRSSESSC
jgi:GNAT superfamily N-acetyltransferase